MDAKKFGAFISERRKEQHMTQALSLIHISLNSSVESGESRINTAVYNATKNAISSMSQDQVITSRDGELSDMVREAIGTNMDQYGSELLKFETKQLDLPDDNKEAVYERMISERDNIAATYKAEGCLLYTSRCV